MPLDSTQTRIGQYKYLKNGNQQAYSNSNQICEGNMAVKILDYFYLVRESMDRLEAINNTYAQVHAKCAEELIADDEVDRMTEEYQAKLKRKEERMRKCILDQKLPFREEEYKGLPPPTRKKETETKSPQG